MSEAEPLTLAKFIKDVAAKYPRGGLVWLDNPSRYPRKVWFILDSLDDEGVPQTDYARRWEDLAKQFYGHPVVARDEAAELRAENERLRADLFEYVLDGFVQGAHRQEDGGYNTGGISTYRDLGDWLVENAGWTRRPGGRGRNQVYDPPKADAASEGQP